MEKVIDTRIVMQRRCVIGLPMVHPDNVGSANVLAKLGFAVEKQLRYSGLQDAEVNLFARNLRQGSAGGKIS